MTTTELLFSAAAAISLVAFVSLILVPAVGSFGRWYEKVGAGFLSLFILGLLVIIGVLAGLAYVDATNDITGVFPWLSLIHI